MKHFVSMLLILPLCGGSAGVNAQDESDTAALISRQQAVKKLIEASTASRQIDLSAHTHAQSRRDQARALYRQAVAALEMKRYQLANELFTSAASTMFEAVRLAGQPQELANKQEREYQQRLESLQALLNAHERIAHEVGTAAPDDDLQQLAAQKIKQAQTARVQDELVAAKQFLDEGYVAAQVALEHMRGGQTMFHELHFANKKEEYDYEIDRNDTHKMLVDVLLQEKIQASQGTQLLVQKLMDRADDTRRQAEQQATRGDFEQAVTTLEQSTKDIVRAIRAAGVYIPG